MQISERRGHRSPTTVGVKSSRVIACSCGIKISAVHHLILTQSTRVTDRWTHGQNYDSQDRPRICSHSKNLTLKTCCKDDLPCQSAALLASTAVADYYPKFPDSFWEFLRSGLGPKMEPEN